MTQYRWYDKRYQVRHDQNQALLPLHFWRNFCSLAHQRIWSASLAFVLSLHFAPLVPFSRSNFDALVTFMSGQRPSSNGRSREKVIGWNSPLALLCLRGSTSKCQVQSILIVPCEITDHSATVGFSAPFVPAPVWATIINLDCRKTHWNVDGNYFLKRHYLQSLSHLWLQWKWERIFIKVRSKDVGL